VGDGEQGNRWRKEERIRSRQEDQQELLAQGRPDRRTGCGLAIQVVAFGFGEEGCRHSAASSRWAQRHEPEWHAQHEPKPGERRPQSVEQPSQGRQ
jgi:hypothetical protein